MKVTEIIQNLDCTHQWMAADCSKNIQNIVYNLLKSWGNTLNTKRYICHT